MKRILIANIFGIGDVLFTTPLIANLKKEMPGVSVDFLCNARARRIVESDPDVDEIFIYEKDEWVDTWKRSKIEGFKKVWQLFTSVRKKRYDAVFDFTLSREFGFFFAASGIPRRIGLNYKRRGLFLTNKTPLTGFEGKHVIEYYLGLLEHIDIPVSERSMRIVPEDKYLEQADKYLSEKGLNAGPLIVVVPGGGASWGAQSFRKRWSPEGFSQVADRLAGDRYNILVVGDPSEEGLCRGVADSFVGNTVIAENNIGIKEYAALLKRSEMVLCNDGGPLHIAAAVGTRTVSIFGPVDDKVYGPYPVSDRHKVITAKEVECRPCYKRFKVPECEKNSACLTGINAEEVYDACKEVLSVKRNT